MSIIVDKLSDLCCETLIHDIGNKFDKRKLEKEINEFINREYFSQIKNLSLDEEIDYGSLCEYIENNLMHDINKYIYSKSTMERNELLETIREKAIYHSGGKNEKLVVEFIDAIFDIVRNFAKHDSDWKTLMLDNYNIDEIIKRLDLMQQGIEKLLSEENNYKTARKEKHWINELTGEKIDPNIIHTVGNISAKITDDTIYAEYKLPNGKSTYVEIDAKNSGIVKNYKLANYKSEYVFDIPEELELNREERYMTIEGKNYFVKIIHLKWGKRIELFYLDNLLVDFNIYAKCFIDEMNKVIHIDKEQ